MMKLKVLVLILLANLLIANSYKVKIDQEDLLIEGYDLYSVSGDILEFVCLSGNVSVEIKGVALATDILHYDTKRCLLFSQGKFIMTLDNYSLAGIDLVFDPVKMKITANDLKFRSKDSVFFDMQQFKVDNNLMMMKNLRFSKGNAAVIDNKNLDFLGINEWSADLSVEEARFYTDWYIIKDPVLKINNKPILYTPIVIYDYSPAAFNMAPAFPSWGIDPYRGNYWRINVQYILNEKMFGAVQAGQAVKKGSGYGFEYIYRLSGRDQIRYLNENWQYGYTEEQLSYRHSFSGPVHQEEDNYFDRRERYTLRQWQKMLFELTYSNYEEDNLEIFHRRPQMQLSGDLNLPGDFTLYTENSYEYVEEVSSSNYGTKIRSLNEFKHAVFIPFARSTFIALGWDNAIYDQDPLYWHQFYGYIDIDFKYKGLFLDFKIKDYFVETGGTPFAFDIVNPGEDFIEPKIEYSFKKKMSIGSRFRKGILSGHIYKELYYINFSQSNWSAKIEYNSIGQSWWAGFTLELF